MATSVPVPFADFGKSTNDLLGKDFPIGHTKLELKTVAPNGVTFNVLGNQDTKTGHISGELKNKYVDYKNGLTVTESWTTGNLLTTQIEIENKGAKGLKLDITGGFLPSEGKKSAKVGIHYKQLGVNSRAHLDVFRGPTITGDVVVSHEGFLFGGDVAFDVRGNNVTRFAAAAGYTAPEYSGAVNAGVIGLGYTQSLRQGVKASVGVLFDTTKLDQAAHKMGFSFVFEA
ncbi:Mitochondrial porin [Modicella reniformis]|uniref:Mitochondrial porin n=1 Tax=Modicella reniformis TaxID=1440133 RepID=A0A9P6MJN0_9FUNG|nr:Mitochondrial porin [Modicella reniformis]